MKTETKIKVSTDELNEILIDLNEELVDRRRRYPKMIQEGKITAKRAEKKIKRMSRAVNLVMLLLNKTPKPWQKPVKSLFDGDSSIG